MNYKKFSDFTGKTGGTLILSTFMVGYEDDGVNRSEIRLPIGDVSNNTYNPLNTFLNSITSSWNDATTTTKQNSSNWSNTYNTVYSNSAIQASVYTTVYNNSGSWLPTGTSLYGNSANWVSTNTSVYNNSASWASTNTTVYNNSASWASTNTAVYNESAGWEYAADVIDGSESNWDSSFTTLRNTSGSWNSTNTSVYNTSGSWNSTNTSVYNTSGDWQSTKTTVYNTSANWNATRTTVFNLSAAWPYRSGDTIVEIIPLSVFSATGIQSSTSTVLAGSERASFILDLGNTTKWKKSGCINNGAPTITWYVVGRSATAGATAEWDLYDKSAGATIAGSNITTTSNTTWTVNSVVIPQANFPNTMVPLAIRSRVQTAGTVDTYSSVIQLTWTVAS